MILRHSISLLLVCSLAFCDVQAESKQDMHIAYVLKNAKLTTEQKTKLRPMLVAYYQDMDKAKASHKALKDKLEEKDDAWKLTEAECDQLFESKQKQEKDQLDVARKHYQAFKTILPANKAYKVIRLCNDKVK